MGEERYTEEELSKAREALADAERLADSGGSEDGIVNRLYYAAFHAAQAVLYDRGIDRSTLHHPGPRRAGCWSDSGPEQSGAVPGRMQSRPG